MSGCSAATTSESVLTDCLLLGITAAMQRPSETLGALVVSIFMHAAGFALMFMLVASGVQYFWGGSVAAVFGVRSLTFVEACKLVGLCWCLSAFGRLS